MPERHEHFLEKNPRYPDPYPEAVERELNELVTERKLEKKKSLRQKVAFALAGISLMSPAVGAFWSDVRENRVEQNAAHISLNVIAPPLDEANNDNLIVVIDGFNARDADYLAGNMAPAIQQVADGEIVSLGYNNALLGRENISETIVDFATEHGKKRVSFVGYSMGGIIATEATADIVKNSNLPVNYLVLISTPDGSDGVRPYQKDELDFMQWLADTVPGAIDSSYFRFAGDVYFYRDSYLKGDKEDFKDVQHGISIITDDINNLIKAIQDALDQMNNPNGTSMQLISQQVYKVNTFNNENEQNTIASQRDQKQLPVELYLGTGEGGYDTVVNDKLSAANFSEDAQKAGLFYRNAFVPGAIHSHYYDTPQAYMETFYQASGPMAQGLKAEVGRHALSLFTQNFWKNPNNNNLIFQAQE